MLLDAIRIWAVIMYIIYSLPVLALAAPHPGFNPLWAIYGLLGGSIIEIFSHMVNDYYDYVYGVDRPGVGTATYRKHPLVEGVSLRRHAAQWLALAAGAITMSLAASFLGRPYTPLFASLGVLLAYAYTGPPFKLKYRGLGHLNLLLGWWLTSSPGVYYMACGELSLQPLLVSLPPILLTIAVLMANNIRDIDTDRAAGVKTLETIIGKKASRALFLLYIAAAYIIQSALSLSLGPTLLLPLLSAPMLAGALKVLREPPPTDADPLVARHTILFSLLSAVGVALR
ncbi:MULTISPECIES: prenyltransferase [Infirmifilum]|nr:prenyltransferase [Infirmifilum uzonense]